MNEIADLQRHLARSERLEDVQEIYGAVFYTQSHDCTTFNLIRYDADPVGLGTLERTWTFLQIIKENNIEVHTLYEKSAEYPLDMRISSLPNGNYSIEVSGVTNAQRGKSSFVSLWEYGENGLTSK